MPSCAPRFVSSRSRGRASSRAPTGSVSGSSATSTTVRSNRSWRFGSGSSWRASSWVKPRNVPSSCLSDLGTEVDQALEQVRSLARGVYPVLLADRGLREALHAAALRNPVRTVVDTDGIARYSPEVESAIYFCCLEAMQNAMKHAAGVESISVSLAVKGDLVFEIRDDGAGFAGGRDLVGHRHHQHARSAAAVGGMLVILTSPGTGTCVSGTVPVSMNGSQTTEILGGNHAEAIQ